MNMCVYRVKSAYKIKYMCKSCIPTAGYHFSFVQNNAFTYYLGVSA